MRKMLVTLLTCCMMLAALTVHAAALTPQNGKSGSSVYWSYDGSGTLTISGKGSMDDYGQWMGEEAPWHKYSYSITKVVVSDGITRIGDWAFRDLFKAARIDIPTSVTELGEGAFSGTALTETNLHEGISKLPRAAYSNCHSLKIVRIPKGMTEFGYQCFWQCESIEKIYTYASAPLYTEEKSKEVTILADTDTIDALPSYTTDRLIISEGIRDIHAADWFGPRQNAKSIELPSSLRILGKKALYRSYNLTEITIPEGVTTIGNQALAESPLLETVTLPQTLKTIERSAFLRCPNLKSITIPPYVTEIGDLAVGFYEFSGEGLPTEGFVIRGYSGTAAEAYAEKYGFAFVDINPCPEGHKEVLVGAVAATCETSGYSGDLKCESCGFVIKQGEVLSALGHDLDDGVVTLEPTETSEGLKVFSCGRCDYQLEEIINAIGNPFTDVMSKDYYFAPVVWAVQNGITAGTSSTRFSPKMVCTRGQVVTFLWRAAGSPEPTENKNPFVDVKASNYYYKAVLWAVEKGITAGTSSTTFSPKMDCTRAQVAAFLWRAAGRPTVENVQNPFVDVSESKYYYDAVLWAVQNDITKGTSTTTFSPTQACTRAQVVSFLFRNRNIESES